MYKTSSSVVKFDKFVFTILILIENFFTDESPVLTMLRLESLAESTVQLVTFVKTCRQLRKPFGKFV